MNEKKKRTIWFWGRVTILSFIVMSVAFAPTQAGYENEPTIPPLAVLIFIGGLMVFFAGFQWAMFVAAKMFTRGRSRLLPYTLSLNPFSGKCLMITGFMPYFCLAIGVGFAIRTLITGNWIGLGSAMVMVVVALFWMRWNRLLARRYCLITDA